MLWWTLLKLKSDKPAERMQAVIELSRMQDPRAGEALAQALKDKDWGVQEQAVRALASRGDRRGPSHLIEMLGSRWSAEAADLLVSMGTAAVGPLAATLENPTSITWRTVSVLKRLGWNPEFPQHQAVFAVVKGKYAEAAAFGPVANGALLAALKEKRADAGEIVRALVQIADARAIGPLIEVLGSEYGDERSAAIAALKRIGSLSADPLVQALKDKSPRVREGAALALGELREPRTTGPLVETMADADPAVHGAAIFALGEMGGPRAVEALIHALGGANDHTREQIFHALGRTVDPRAAAALAHALQDRGLPRRLQESAFEALRAMPAGAPLAEALTSTDEDLRAWGLRVSQWLLDPQAVELLSEDLKHGHPIVREKTAEILGQLRSAAAVATLVEAIKDPEESVCMAATKALGNIGDTRAVEPLIQALRRPERGARRWAATALGELKDTRAAEPLIRAANDEDAGVRAHAARSLGMIGTAQAVLPLESALCDPEGAVREAAVYALAGIDDPRARELVESALSHDDLLIRTAATKALKRKPNPNSIATLLANLETRVEELSTASAAVLETLLERSASAASVENLRAITRLEDAIVIGTVQGEGYLRQQTRIDCRQLKQLACRELLRRGLQV